MELTVSGDGQIHLNDHLIFSDKEFVVKESSGKILINFPSKLKSNITQNVSNVSLGKGATFVCSISGGSEDESSNNSEKRKKYILSEKPDTVRVKNGASIILDNSD